MANMSYCRFENTLYDLMDCYNNINNELSSDHEVRARKAMIKLCQEILEAYDPEVDAPSLTPPSIYK